MSDNDVRTRLRVTREGDRVAVTFTRGLAEVALRFPVNEDPEVQTQAGDDLSVLTDNIVNLIEAANLEIEAAVLRQEAEASDG